jgi:hypothetical protein
VRLDGPPPVTPTERLFPAPANRLLLSRVSRLLLVERVSCSPSPTTCGSRLARSTASAAGEWLTSSLTCKSVLLQSASVLASRFENRCLRNGDGIGRITVDV